MFKKVGERGAYVDIGEPIPIDEEKPAVLRLYTNRDAGIIYDLMREKYSEFDEHWLLVQMVPQGELRSPDDQKVLAAKRIDTSRIIHPEGEQPMEEVCWRGERPRFPYRAEAGLMTLVGDPEFEQGEFDVQKTAMAMEVFGGKRMDWKKEGKSAVS